MKEKRFLDMPMKDMDYIIDTIKVLVHDKKQQSDIFTAAMQAYQEDKLDADNRQMVTEFINSFR